MFSVSTLLFAFLFGRAFMAWQKAEMLHAFDRKVDAALWLVCLAISIAGNVWRF